MGVSSIYPSPPHLNHIDVWNLFNSMISFLARRNTLISEILYKVSNVILHGKTFLKVNARERWNDKIGNLVPNDTASYERRACPIARLIKIFPLFTWHDRNKDVCKDEQY